MTERKYKIEVADFGKRGDLKNGYGYSVYLNENGKKAFESKLYIYGFDGFAIIGYQKETNWINTQTKKQAIERQFPFGIEQKINLEKAEKRAHKMATTSIAKSLGMFISSDRKLFQIIDKTALGKKLNLESKIN
jgi:hypothetical protein